MNCKINHERLYLHKGDQPSDNVYVEAPILPQHQLNALRFMYNQYRKKNPGIILNDPEGYGKTVEVVLFLKAILTLLKQPILIICNEDEVGKWVDNLQKQADLTEDIAVSPSNPYIKGKKVLIVTWSELQTFLIRNWSVLVVDHDKPRKEVLKYNFNADFKIWVSSIDMKDDLDTFIAIYEWLHPEGDYRLLRHEGTELEKKIHRDAFMQDIVIRGSGYDSPSIKIPIVKATPENTEKNNRKKKNKDTTGTKIKRSKKTVNEATVPLELNAVKLETVNKDLNVQNKRQNLTKSNVNTNSNLRIGNSSVENSGTIKRIRLGQKNQQTDDNNAVNVTKDGSSIRIKDEIMDEEISIENEDLDRSININIKTEENENISSQNIRLEYAETDDLVSNVQMDVDLNTESPSILSFNNVTKTKSCTNGNFTDRIDQNKVNTDSNGFQDECNDVLGDEIKATHSDLVKSSLSNDINEIKDSDVEMCPNASEIMTENKFTNKSFDSKMDEMNQKAMQKFKGTLLDSLF